MSQSSVDHEGKRTNFVKEWVERSQSKDPAKGHL